MSAKAAFGKGCSSTVGIRSRFVISAPLFNNGLSRTAQRRTHLPPVAKSHASSLPRGWANLGRGWALHRFAADGCGDGRCASSRSPPCRAAADGRKVAAAEGDSPMIEDADDHRRAAFQHPPCDQFVAGGLIAGLQGDQVPPARRPVGGKPGRRQQQPACQVVGHHLTGVGRGLPRIDAPFERTRDRPHARQSRGRRPIVAARNGARAATGSSPATGPSGDRSAERISPGPPAGRPMPRQCPASGRRQTHRPAAVRMPAFSRTRSATRSRPAASSSRVNSGSMAESSRRYSVHMYTISAPRRILTSGRNVPLTLERTRECGYELSEIDATPS